MSTITIARSVTTAVRPSPRVLETACMFGLGVDEKRSLSIIPEIDIPLPRPGIIFITGPSGGGKTTVLRELARAARKHVAHVIDFDDLPALPDAPLVDAFDGPLEAVTSLLARAGLGDAFVMLRSPGQLSDGQRSRLRLAQAMDIADSSDEPALIIADEFGATLDRTTAGIIARNVRKWVTRSTNITFACATTHDDLLEPLEPDVLIYKGLGEAIEVVAR